MSLSTSLYKRVRCPAAKALNADLVAGFSSHADLPTTRRSHYFGGRYENIYINSDEFPAFARLLEIASEHAASLLGTQASRLKYGGWFNAMAPGQSTTRHTHDDSDEVLSAVYYVEVPKNAGELVLTGEQGPVSVKPEAGSFVFFSADVEHEVTENRGNHLRLSIGMNFGYKEEA